MAEMIRTGGCACGDIRFEARGEPYRVGLCHCLVCRKYHGAPFNAFAMFSADRVTFTGAAPKVYATSELGRRYFCPACSAPVCTKYGRDDEIELHLGSFDEPNLFAPTYEAWIPRRENWLSEMRSIVRRYSGNRTGRQRTEP